MTASIGLVQGNNLNNLTAREHSAFLNVAAPMPRSSREDLDYAVKNGCLPMSAMAEVVNFFSKENQKVLDLFSGEGRMLNIAGHSNRTAVGVDLEPAAKEKYSDLVQDDMLAEEQEFVVADAKQYLKESSDKFDFIFMGPPRGKSRACREVGSGDIAALKIEGYVSYLAECVDLAAQKLEQGKFVAVHADLVFHKGNLYDVPGLLACKMHASNKARLRMIKVWYYDRGRSGVGNLGIAVSHINTSHLLAFEVT